MGVTQYAIVRLLPIYINHLKFQLPITIFLHLNVYILILVEPFETPICGNLTDPENGMVEIDDAFTLANYSCDEGFQLMGPMFRNCQIDGNWTGEAPTCVCK